MSAKSTSARIIYWFPAVSSKQCVADDLLAGLNAGENLLAVAVEHLAGVNLGALELIAAGGQIDPVAVMQMQHGIGRNHGVRLLRRGW